MENIKKRNVSIMILHLLYCLHVVRRVMNSGVIWLSYWHWARPYHSVVRIVVRLRPLLVAHLCYSTIHSVWCEEVLTCSE